MHISRIDLLNHAFSRAMRGYDPVEVDAVIKEAALAIGALSEERNALEARADQLEAQLAEHRGREATLRDTLMTTQRVTADLKAAAQKEAQLILEAAHAKAESLLNQCNQRLNRIQEDIAVAHRVRTQVYMQVRASLEQNLALLNMTFVDSEDMEKIGQPRTQASQAKQQPAQSKQAARQDKAPPVRADVEAPEQ